MGRKPDWYDEFKRVSSLRFAWPGVSPWEWDSHPIERDRALCMLIADQMAEEARTEKRRAQAESH